ncbi:fungal Zn binuclear cluster domain-containing protein [Blastomyces dermatitidis ATCC 18188]|uniref:Fungal Zn binuclear cluster domain-containing protein n=1 Tax=Ajellomyces dermatitidis (strain ATCC 18188 / CBS 674.68) TaxID=653446 RepID=F2TNV6_AJEDA|nr:fungal Zn binuclear cluster domain-containing protein [Blastomyces dermatitidis ATCC 18188]
MAKRHRSIGAFISGVLLRMERASSDTADSPAESVHGTRHCGWDKTFLDPFETDLFIPPSPLQLSANMGLLDPSTHSPLYHTSQNGVLVRTLLLQIKNENTMMVLCKNQPFMSPQPSEHVQRILNPSSRELSSSLRMSPHTPAVEPRIIPSSLQQLRDDYAAAASRLRSLEEAIQNVDCQLIKRHLAHTGDQSPVNTYSEPPGLNIKNNNTKKTTPLTPPPERKTAVVMVMQTVQQLEAPQASVHKEAESRPQIQANSNEEIPVFQDVTAVESGRREQEFQNTFDTIMDFGAGSDTMFQSFNYDFSEGIEGV